MSTIIPKDPILAVKETAAMKKDVTHDDDEEYDDDEGINVSSKKRSKASIDSDYEDKPKKKRARRSKKSKKTANKVTKVTKPKVDKEKKPKTKKAEKPKEISEEQQKRNINERLERAKTHGIQVMGSEVVSSVHQRVVVLGSTGNSYTVDIKAKPSCSCPDWIYRRSASGGKCKHIMNVLLRLIPEEESGLINKKVYSEKDLELMFGKEE